MSESTVSPYPTRNVRWNFSVNLLDITLITTGLSLVSRETVLPVLVRQLTDSTVAVGLIPAVHAMGFYLPQLLAANFSEQLRYKKPFVMWLGGVGERVPYLLMALAIGWLAEPAPQLTLVLFFVLLTTTAFSAGIATPAWYDMIAKAIPVNRRGLWSGLGHGLGALMGVIGAFFVGRILEAHPFPNNFARLFGLAFAAMVISWIGLALNREAPSTSTKEPLSITRYMRQLPTVLRRDPNYARFLLSRTTVQLGAMGMGFFMVYGTDRFGLDGAYVGLLTGVLVGSKALMNLAWGVVGDRAGHKGVLAAAAFTMSGAALLALLTQQPVGLVAVFALLGAYLAADEVSALNIILEFCEPADRPTYIGLTNTLLAPILIAAPLIGGLIAGRFGYPTLFGTALSIALCGGLLLTWWVREPRRAI